MKVKDKNLDDFTLPLTNRAVAILQETHQLTSWSPLVFHSVIDLHKPINPATINKALKIMGFDNESLGKKQTIHSFRGTFRSLIETHANEHKASFEVKESIFCLLYTSPSPRDRTRSRMPSSA